MFGKKTTRKSKKPYKNQKEFKPDDSIVWSATHLHNKQDEVIQKALDIQMKDFKKNCYKKINSAIMGAPHLVNISSKEVSFYPVKRYEDEQWKILESIQEELAEKEYYTWIRTSIEGHLVIGFQWRNDNNGWRT